MSRGSGGSDKALLLRAAGVAAALAAIVVAVSPVLADVHNNACHRDWPLWAQDDAGHLISAAPDRSPVVCATSTGYATSETTIAVTSTGALFFSPAHTENSLARSTDHGTTWQLSAPAQT